MLSKQKMRGTFIAVLSALSVLVAGCSNNTGASKTEKGSGTKTDFPKKDIHVIVPVAPGGGFDTQARILLPFWKKYLPHDVSMVVDNKPGGDWSIGINTVYHAKPDGYTVGLFNIPGNTMNQMTGKAEYDLTKFEWIGRMSYDPSIAAVTKKSGLKTILDFKGKDDIHAGIVSVGSSSGLGMLITAHEVGFKWNPVTHKSSNEAVLAAIRGDVDWVDSPYEAFKGAIEDTKQMIPVWVYSDKRLPQLPNVPTVKELGYPQLAEMDNVIRLLGATPGTPPEIMEILRTSFKKAMEDPECIKQLAVSGTNPEYLDEKGALDLVKQSLEGYKKYKDLVK